MSEVLILKPAYTLLEVEASGLCADTAVAVKDGRIAAISSSIGLRKMWPMAREIELPECLLMPGLVNAHQHGRGISLIQLGYADTFLEPWMAARRGRGLVDCYSVTRLAAARMIANGVTSTIHANYTYGSGDYEREVLEQLRAYESVGLRVTMCVGAMDQGITVYPPHEACFLSGLPTEVRQWMEKGSKLVPYAGDGAATIQLMRCLRSAYDSHPLIRFCYGPAGPQWVSDDLWRAIARDARENDLGIHFHALESPAQKIAASRLFPDGVFAHLARLGAMTPRTVLAHGVWIHEDEMNILARTGATIVGNPGCNLRMRNGIAPFARYFEHGIPVAVGTDNCTVSDDEDLLSELRLAGILARVPDWNGPQPPTTSQILAMATLNGAKAAQFQGEIGALKTGMRADMVAFSLDRTRRPYLDADMPLLDAFLARARGADVKLTMVEGKILYRDGQYTDVSIGELEEQAAASALKARVPRSHEDGRKTDTYIRYLNDHYRFLSRHAER